MTRHKELFLRQDDEATVAVEFKAHAAHVNRRPSEEVNRSGSVHPPSNDEQTGFLLHDILHHSLGALGAPIHFLAVPLLVETDTPLDRRRKFLFTGWLAVYVISQLTHVVSIGVTSSVLAAAVPGVILTGVVFGVAGVAVYMAMRWTKQCTELFVLVIFIVSSMTRTLANIAIGKDRHAILNVASNFAFLVPLLLSSTREVLALASIVSFAFSSLSVGDGVFGFLDFNMIGTNVPLFVHTTMAVITLAVVFASIAIIILIDNALTRSEREARRTARIVEEVTEHLVAYDTDSARKLIREHEDTIPARIGTQLLGLLQKLRAYRPYLPATVFMVQEIQSGETEECSNEVITLREGAKLSNTSVLPHRMSILRGDPESSQPDAVGGEQHPTALISNPAGSTLVAFGFMSKNSLPKTSVTNSAGLFPASGASDSASNALQILLRASTQINEGWSGPKNFSRIPLCVVLVVFRGELVARQPSIVRDLVSLSKTFGGVIENMAFDHVIISFGRPGSPAAGAMAEPSAMECAMEQGRLLEASFGDEMWQVTIDTGKAWLCTAGGRRKFNFVGGGPMEKVWKLHTIGFVLGSSVVASTAAAEAFQDVCCPVEVVCHHPLGGSSTEDLELVFEVAAAAPHNDLGDGQTISGPYGSMAAGELGMTFASPLSTSRERLRATLECLGRGDLREALTNLQYAGTLTRHARRIEREIMRSIVSRSLYCLRPLGWGTFGATPRSCLEEESEPVAAPARLVPSHPQSKNSGQTHFERVNQVLADRNKAMVEDIAGEEEALFEMFLTPQTGEEISSYIVDNNGRRWQRGKRTYGSGSFSTVFSAVGEYGNPVAVKCVDLESRVVSASAEELSREIHTLSSLRHENIVGYIGDCLEGQFYYVFMECVPGGSLAGLLKRFTKLPREAVARFVRDALHGLQYLHANGVVHCDIKPANILVTGRGTCKLSDFGSAMNSKMAKDSCKGGEVRPEDFLPPGTAVYMAPEVCRGNVESASDVWSLGVTVFELLTGALPWKQPIGDLSRFIVNLGKDESMAPDLSLLNHDFGPLSFVQACLKRDPSVRASVANLLGHTFLRTDKPAAHATQ